MTKRTRNESAGLDLFIRTTNVAKAGSFGEFLFRTACQEAGRKVVPVHARRTDFEVDDIPVDVKTTRAKVPFGKKLLARYKPAKGVQLALVHLNGEEARLLLHDGSVASFDAHRLDGLFLDWKNGAGGRKHEPGPARASRKLPDDIRQAVNEVFIKAGLNPPHILYRTIMFPGESPHNLLPSQRRERDRNGWTVLLVFDGHASSVAGIKEIIAFPDTVAAGLPRLVKIRTTAHVEGIEKVDLGKLPSNCRFHSLYDLNAGLK